MSSQKTILIIEDDIDIVEAMKIVLESSNFNVISAYNPQDGLELAEQNPPDLIILDVMFQNSTNTSGFDYAVKFRENPELVSIPILMVTAVNTQRPGYNFNIQDESEFLPIDGFIDKPAQPDDLIQKVQSLIDHGPSRWADWPNKN